MAEVSAIEWTDATFNPWIGCTKISAACDHCYAETLSKARLGVPWGAGQPRRRTAESTWKQPLAWNRKAAKEGRRMRVFCASLADVFDAEVPDEWRADLFALIDQTPNLDWLLLTKRPAVARKVMPADPRKNVWLGTTVENQKMAEARIPHLLETPAAVRFLSMEPLLGPVDLTEIDYNPFLDSLRRTPRPDPDDPNWPQMRYDALRGHLKGPDDIGLPRLDWVITGGESGPGARPSHPDWFRSIRDQCAAAGVPFLFKQWGEWVPQVGAVDGWDFDDNPEISRFDHRDWKGDRWGAPYRPIWSDEIEDDTVSRVGKKAAGRHLDGVLHDGYPVR